MGKVSGEILIEGKRASINSPSDAIKHGIGFVTEDRKRLGLILDQTVLNNMTLAALTDLSGRFITHRGREKTFGEKARKDLRVKTSSVETVVGTLSGGNQQKVVLAKWLLTNPKILFLDEPTRGIDIGAKGEIQALVNELAKEGLGVLMISSELEELVEGSDRVVVMRDGKLSAELRGKQISQDSIINAMAEGT